MLPIGLVEELLNLDRLAKLSGSKLPMKRFIYTGLLSLATQNRLFIGIAGLRGAGKTILLRQLAAELEHSFYLSADTLPPGTNLFELTTLLEQSFGINYVMIDEIHAISGWQAQIKKIYDFQETVRIIFTSSSSLELNDSRYDLSRRLAIIPLPLFSFREYLSFKKNTSFPVLSLDDIMNNHRELYREIYSFEADFKDFCSTGALPASLASPLPSVILSIIDKVIQKDMMIIGKLSQEDVLNIRSVLLFIARAGIEGISFSSVSRNTGISKYKVQQYINLMESASLLKIILPYGANILPEPKILLSPCLRIALAHGSDPDRFTGAIREEFFIHHTSGAGYTINYLKSKRGEKLPDYILFQNERRIVFEIGGAGKSTSQFKGTEVKEKVVLNQPGIGKGIPLLLFGFLW